MILKKYFVVKHICALLCNFQIGKRKNRVRIIDIFIYLIQIFVNIAETSLSFDAVLGDIFRICSEIGKCRKICVEL